MPGKRISPRRSSPESSVTPSNKRQRLTATSSVDAAAAAAGSANSSARARRSTTAKSKSGVVTLNLWDIGERTKKGKEGAFQSIYDSNFQPTPSYNVIKNINE